MVQRAGNSQSNTIFCFSFILVSEYGKVSYISSLMDFGCTPRGSLHHSCTWGFYKLCRRKKLLLNVGVDSGHCYMLHTWALWNDIHRGTKEVVINGIINLRLCANTTIFNMRMVSCWVNTFRRIQEHECICMDTCAGHKEAWEDAV